ncbi:alpha/beta fold hydrolase [Agromyces aerolatus]|uniref:alpha/beta fold hydrolase n=1 Tax=Agromyces sp. LY-1074 TaxID=3074080 RepID=UPI00285C0C2D|nr:MULTISPECIES: alpha/beta fold hydrolase [unclassified Agromyces]MDR5701559.1 alpha/beta fold hydrolase [Agromyces sp. LY-1074]MDR5707834.1 alpha/beta fold hydrolase [Agromyces sp. LY-1358]
MSDPSGYFIGTDIVARDVWTTVPLDWANPDGETIELYARELVAAERRHDDLPLLLHLQGGPGGKGVRPLGRSDWLDRALDRFRVIVPDQRGTGRSTPLSGDDLETRPAAESARRLALHRADSIVRDFEALRARHYAGRQWWTIGQSYGGFLTLHYLSVAPEAIVGSAVAGGLPSLDPDAAEVYRRTFPRVLEKNHRFRERAPHLTERIGRVAELLASQDVRLPDGDRLTVRRLQTLGLDFGMGPGFERVHWLFDEAFADRGETRLSETFLASVGLVTGFASNPLFIALQESIYGPGPTAWAAQREREQHPEFAESARPLAFTGEMVFPWMFEEIRALRGFRAGVDALAQGEWPIELYDRSRLAANEVPIEAVVYFDDMYVDAGLSLDTARRVGNLNAWVTNQHEHDGIREDGVAERLFSALERRLGGTVRERPRTGEGRTA